MPFTRTHTHPFLFFFLCFPYGITSGFLTVTLPYVLTTHHFSVAQTAAIVAAGVAPNMWRFLWAPVCDLTLTPHKWYLIGLLMVIVSVSFLSFVPLSTANATLLSLLAFVCGASSTVMRIPNSCFQVYTVKERQKGRCGGWDQAGNLGGTGLGGGLGVWLATAVGYQWVGIILSLLMACCAFALLYVAPFKNIKDGSIAKNLRLALADFWLQLRTPIFLFTTLILCTPIGSGAASLLWSTVAQDWQASAGTVALVTGTLSAVVTIFGSIFGGWVADRWGCWWTFFGSGIAMALVTTYMASTPTRESNYIVGVLAYAFPLGMAYAAVSAVVLAVVNGRLAGTKIAILFSLANVPPVYMTALMGWVHDVYNVRWMLWTETILGAVFALFSLAVLAILRRKEEKQSLKTNYLSEPAATIDLLQE